MNHSSSFNWRRWLLAAAMLPMAGAFAPAVRAQTDGSVDPTFDPGSGAELHDAFGVLVNSNDDWKDTQQSEIVATDLQPTKDREAAIFATLAPGAYTAIVRGKNDTTGVALVEIYGLTPPL